MEVYMYNVFNLHLTEKCNYKCRYCFAKFACKKEMTKKEAFLLVDKISDYFITYNIRSPRINLVGGEPLLIEYFADIVEYINSKNIAVSIVTNASLLTINMIENLKGKIRSIGISVDSINEDTNKQIGRHCYGRCIGLNQLLNLCSEIKDFGIDLKINTVISKLNLDEDFKWLYSAIMPNRVKVFRMLAIEGINDGNNDLSITDNEWKNFCDKHCELNIVFEDNDDMQGGYIMINPAGQMFSNTYGAYDIIGSCFSENIDVLIKKSRVDYHKFSKRY